LTGGETSLFCRAVSATESGPLRLTSADFDAFLEPATAASRSSASASAPASSRPSGVNPAHHRRALRERIEAWARALAPRLAELGLPFEVVVPDELEQHLSSGAPRVIAQRVLFLRDGFSRSSVPRTAPEVDPLRSHAYLALTIDSVHLAVSVEICPEAEADVKNMRARIADPTALLELTALLESLPDEFAIGVLGVPSFPRAQGARADDIRALLDNSERNRRPLWLGWSVKREVALAHTDVLDELLADALVALAQIYKLIAWAPDNDLIAATRRGAWRERRATLIEERRERGREERRKRRAQDRNDPPRKEGTRREREDARRAVPETEAEPAASSNATTRRGTKSPTDAGDPASAEARSVDLAARGSVLERRPVLPSSLRGRGRRKTVEADVAHAFEKGAKVRILAGPFARRIGIVEDVPSKERVRVRLGPLVATIDLADVTSALEGNRPRLASSHRRPAERRRG
jgi:hypothetical protein